ncbi:SMI1/KNR4 family protein [Niallia circulans]|uniref:SMI1/KNR4 family protein n=1 Tax=Niallia circulans TaxID=1397 RepID=A0A553SSH7_NIACI|nr:SMI1/KNR4 family protein [Niallia circulans]TRZ39949.1 SMI1/KNR4 family protein [Niallia circulans]
MNEILSYIMTKKPGVDEIDIFATEEKLGAAFPEQFRQLYKLVNNAEIGEWLLFPIKDRNNVKKTWDDIVRHNIEAQTEGLEGWIVVGEDGTGDKLCLKSSNGLMEQEVYIWYHEDCVADKVAPSLKELIILLAED